MLVTVFIGIWASRRVRTSTDYVNAGRRLPLMLSSAALFALWFGSETLFGATSSFLEKGVLGIIEDPLGGVLCLILFGAIFARKLYRMNLVTLGDLFRLRYGPKIELIASCFMLITFFGYIAAQLVALGLLLQLLSGVSLSTGIIISAGVVTLYTLAGGMWAISITDFAQGVIIVIGLIWAAFTLVQDAGGIQQVIASAPDNHFRFLPENKPLDWMHYLAAWITLGLGSLPSQDIFQRMNSSKNEDVAVRSFYIGSGIYLIIAILPIFIVLAAWQLYPQLLEGDMQQVLSKVVKEKMPIGVQFMFFGALMSAIFSTCSGAILAPASILAENIIKPIFGNKMTDKNLLLTLRLGVLVMAAAGCWMALLRNNIFELVAESSVLGLVTLLVPMTFAVFFPEKATRAGTITSMILGFSVWWVSEYYIETEAPALIYGFLASLTGMLLGNNFIMRKIYGITASIVILLMLGCNTPQTEQTVIKTYPELVDFFKEWRKFETPPLLNNAPDYTKETFEKRMPQFKVLQRRLLSADTSGWAIHEKVDFEIVKAEMNGFDFNYRILRSWERDPAYYKMLWLDRSDVPAHEGPTPHYTTELWTYQFPLRAEERVRLLADLGRIPPFCEQAKRNLTGNARDLWIAGIRDIKTQAGELEQIKGLSGVSDDQELLDAIDKASAASEDLAKWLEMESSSKTGSSGIGKENYTWYLQNVHLVPMTWEDEVLLLKRELARAWSALKLEEHRNRELPALIPAADSAEYAMRADQSAKSLMNFLEKEEIVTVKDYFDPALRVHLGKFVPEERRNFFWITAHLDARPLYSHFYHWFELAQMDNEPHTSEIRKNPLLYNIFDSRNEGLATAVEEMFMQAGLYDDDPRVREIVYIMIAQRAARGLGSLYAHANMMTMEEAGSIHSEYTPRGWMKTEKELLIFEQHLYLRQPGYGTSYITGKYLLEDLMMEYARKNETFGVKNFFDDLNATGNIPVSLVKWELTGMQ